ncbi:retrovirus-related pol polyprotein from transposon TNT 1-94, partial [Tanacetum coccineum]
MLSNQKPSGEKLGLGFNSFEASSSGTKEIKFVKAQKKASFDGGRDIRKKGLNVMKLGNKPKDKFCLAAIDENSTLWHRRLGYSQNSKAYIILNKHTRKVEESLNVTFNETPPPSKTSPLVDDDLDEEEAIKVTEKKNLENDIVDETLEIDEIVNIKESRNHPLENVIGNLNQRTLRSQAQNQSNFFCFISTIEPKNVNEALIDDSWIVVMREELNQFIANDARLVAQGYNQQEGIDYDETYALVARLESIRILLAYACALDFKLFQMDVKSAFWNGFINEEGDMYQNTVREESPVEVTTHLKDAKRGRLLFGMRTYPVALHGPMRKKLRRVNDGFTYLKIVPKVTQGKRDGFLGVRGVRLPGQRKQINQVVERMIWAHDSGAGDEDYFNKALLDYEVESGVPFTLRHCWEILKKSPKWWEQVVPKYSNPNAAKKSKTSGSSSFNTESGDASFNLNVDAGDEDENEVQEIPRTMGRDRARGSKKKGAGSSGSSVNINDEALARLMVSELATQTASIVAMKKEKCTAYMEIKRREVDLRERELEMQVYRQRQEDMRFYMQPYDHLTRVKLAHMEAMRAEIKA